MPKPSVHGPIPTVHNPTYRSSAGTELTIGQPTRAVATQTPQQATRRFIIDGGDVEGSFSVLEVEGASVSFTNLGNGRLKLTVDSLYNNPSVVVEGDNIDWSLGRFFDKQLDAGANVLTFSNVEDGSSITIALHGDAGSSTVSWPADVEWAGGTAPEQTATGTDVVTLVRINGRTYGSPLQDFSAP